jgi:hypothetical protein
MATVVAAAVEWAAWAAWISDPVVHDETKKPRFGGAFLFETRA